MRVKVKKYGIRPDFNPLTEISFTGTLCLAEGIRRTFAELGYVDEDEFLRSVIRKAIIEAGCFKLMEAESK